MIQRVLGGLTAAAALRRATAEHSESDAQTQGQPARQKHKLKKPGIPLICEECRQPVGRKGAMPVRRTSTGYAHVQCPRRR